jgi:uncharacterized damage-inducible protein DinB
MNSNEAKSVADFLIADFENEIQITLHILAALPDDGLDYHPDAVSKTGLGLVRHLAVEDEWLLNCVANGAFTPPPDDSEACGIMNAADGIACYEEKVPAALNRIRSLSGEKLAGIMDVFGRKQVPAVNVFAEAIKHSVHHRGQLTSYMRAMGGKVPAIYGPSADEK